MKNKRIINDNTSKKISIQMIVCCIFVVTYHSTGYKYYDLNHSFLNNVAELIVDLKNPLCQLVALPNFCFWSGFLFYKNISDYQFPYSGIKKRVFSLLLPYFLWNFIWTLFMVTISFFPTITSQMTTINGFSWTFEEFVGGVLFHQYCGVTWYLLYMFVYSLLSPIICKLFENKTIAKFTILTILLISPAESIIFKNNLLIWPLYLYLLGAYTSIYHFNCINNDNKNKCNKTVIFIFVIMMFICSRWVQAGYFYSLLYNCFRIIGFYLAWNILNFFYKDIQNKKWMEYYFYIYVFHNIPLLCIDKILRFIMPDNWLGLLLNHFIGVLIVILMSIISAWIIEQNSPKLWYVLTGRRDKKIKFININKECEGK